MSSFATFCIKICVYVCVSVCVFDSADYCNLTHIQIHRMLCKPCSHSTVTKCSFLDSRWCRTVTIEALGTVLHGSIATLELIDNDIECLIRTSH